ncbi:MAG TPA: DUF3035 domain-containing protein [Rhodospirillaceae bacterium]|nr:DUF3035 domain-containing protein [Rhodospirillaceae bacterium]
MISTHASPLRICRAAVAAGLAVLALSGCSDARRALGYDKAPPDEFTVVSRAPLSQPPDFSLRPPNPGAPRPQEGTVRDQAKGALLGSKGAGAGAGAGNFSGRSQGEQLLLAKSGADKPEPDVRRKVNEETTKLIEADNGFTDKILFWQEKPQPGVVIDAAKEAKRLRDNAATGKSPVEGNTPEIVRRRKGWLEDIF